MSINNPYIALVSSFNDIQELGFRKRSLLVKNIVILLKCHVTSINFPSATLCASNTHKFSNMHSHSHRSIHIFSNMHSHLKCVLNTKAYGTRGRKKKSFLFPATGVVCGS